MPRMKQLGWFVAIWAMSVTALGVIAFTIRYFVGS